MNLARIKLEIFHRGPKSKEFCGFSSWDLEKEFDSMIPS